MSEWKTYKLGDIAKVIDSLHKTPTYTEKGYPMVRVTDLKGGYLRTKDCLLVSEDVYLDFSRNHKSEIGDIVISRVGSYGITSYVNEPIDFCLGQNTAFICSNGMDSKYLFYYLNSPKGKQEIEGFVTGSTQKTISLKSIKSLEILAPGLPTQRQIAQILSSLDDKIELNLQMNQTLEAMAQAVFKEWFVDFKFPGFDGELVDGLPKGWRMGVLGEMVDKLSKGTTPTQKDLGSLEVQIPFLKVKDISDIGTISKNNLELIPIEVHQNQLKRSILETNDILFSIAGTIGRVAIVDETLNFSNCNQAIAFIRLSDKNAFLEYIHLWLRSEAVQNNIKSSIVQGVQANVSLTVLNNIEVLIPNDETLCEWNNLIKPIYHRIRTTIYQIESLTQTRDTLLPKLISGKMRLNCD